jgi:zinc transporter ZupT
MVGASLALLRDGALHSVSLTGVGIFCGLVGIYVAGRLVHEDEERLFASLSGADARRALLLIGVMAAHSAAEGAGIGVSFGDGERFGWAVTAMLALHNVPEGLAIALIMVPAGASVRSAAVWSVISSLPQPLIAVPAFAFVTIFAPALPWGLGLAGGAMIWMAAVHLIPEACEAIGRPRAWTLALFAAAAAFAALLFAGF